MTGKERRNAVFHTIKDSKGPVSGKELAEKFGVSRQVIVQDMALIRAKGYEIISTNRGYLLNAPQSVIRVFQVCHTDEELREELYAIVDLGGRVKNVMVEHQVYGHLEAELNVTSRRTAEKFLEDIQKGKSSPLTNLTSDYHWHIVEADSEETLDEIEKMLKEKGFLVEEP